MKKLFMLTSIFVLALASSSLLYAQPSIFVDNTGNVGVGTTSPGIKLQVIGSIFTSKDFVAESYAPGIWFSELGEDFFAFFVCDEETVQFQRRGPNFGGFESNPLGIEMNADGGTLWVSARNGGGHPDSKGCVGIGVTAPATGYKLDVAGYINCSGITYPSDMNHKKEIKDIDNALDKILQIDGVEFKWKDTNKQSLGVIAQKVEEVFPELVHTDKASGLKSVEYGNLVAPLIEAIKEQQIQIKELKARLDKLS